MLTEVFGKGYFSIVAFKAQMQVIDTLGIALDGVPFVERDTVICFAHANPIIVLDAFCHYIHIRRWLQLHEDIHDRLCPDARHSSAAYMVNGYQFIGRNDSQQFALSILIPLLPFWIMRFKDDWE